MINNKLEIHRHFIIITLNSKVIQAPAGACCSFSAAAAFHTAKFD